MGTLHMLRKLSEGRNNILKKPVEGLNSKIKIEKQRG